MMKLNYAALLLAGTALTFAAPAFAAQDPAPAQEAPDPADPDASDAAADAAIANVQPVDDQQAKIELLEQQVQAMQEQLEGLKAGLVKVTPSADKPAWYADTKIGGKAFFNFSNISQKSNGAKLSTSGAQTELKRFYISVDHKFNDMFSANLTTDFRYGANGVSKDVLVYVKKAYFQAKLSNAAVFRIGAADLPWVPFAEGVYGYRHIENTLIDRLKYGTSADWGLHLGGDLAGGQVSYAVSAINGAGYKTLARNSDTIDFEGRISAKPVNFITVGVGAYTGKLGKQAAGVPNTPHRATRFNALAAYTGTRATLGIEYFTARNWNNVTSASADKSDGWSAFGSFAVTPKISLFARYDWVKPSKLINPALKENYFNVGAQYTPVKNVDLALVYKRDRARNGFVSTSNGTIGGLDQGTYDEVGLFGQFKF
ncbi:MAG: hypothetical protein V4444_00640 [Pseudomonadota bacterium]